MKVGFCLCGQIEKWQNEIVEATIKSLMYATNSEILFTRLKKKINYVDKEKIRIIPELNKYSEYTKECEELIKKEKITHLIIFKMNVMSGFKKNNDKQFINFCNKVKNKDFEDDTKGLNFEIFRQSIRLKLFPFIAGLNGVKIIHYSFDPDEVSFESFKEINYLRLADLQYKDADYIEGHNSLIIAKGEKANKTKELDFCFAASVNIKEREYLLDEKNKGSFNFNNLKYFVAIAVSKEKGEKKDLVSQTEYYELLAKSKFTLIVPSYNKEAFSIIRFIEALSRDCIPLVWNKCCLDNLNNALPEITKIIYNYLLIEDLKDLEYKINNFKNAKEIINKIKNTNDWKNMKSKKRLKERWQNVLQM